MTARLDLLCEGRDNNLNLIRFVAAACVLVSHAFPITLGVGAAEPLEPFLGRSLGWVSVAIFFIISGFLITQSFERSSHLVNWTTARILRIFPGLLIVLLITVCIIGPITSTIPIGEYIKDTKTLTYVPRNMSLAFLQYNLPGVFTDNPYPEAINGSLWTLIYEVACYALVFALGVTGLYATKMRSLMAIIMVMITYLTVKYLDEAHDFGHPRMTALMRLALPFTVGIALYLWRDKIVLKWRYSLLLAAITAMLYPTAIFTEAFIIWLGYTVFLMAYLPGGAIRKFNNLGDYSYGMYIYAFPVQQLIAFYLAPQSPLINIIIAFPITLIMAIASWSLVEERALGWRAKVSEHGRHMVQRLQALFIRRTHL